MPSLVKSPLRRSTYGHGYDIIRMVFYFLAKPKNQATTLLGGILPFGAAFVELYFVLSSLFASRAYYAFGFLALTAGVVGLTTATVTILFTYFLLCAEEYRCVHFPLTA